jgi:hypothetical protein
MPFNNFVCVCGGGDHISTSYETEWLLEIYILPPSNSTEHSCVVWMMPFCMNRWLIYAQRLSAVFIVDTLMFLHSGSDIKLYILLSLIGSKR